MRRAALAGAGGALTLLAACATSTDEDTLQPLPIEGDTIAITSSTSGDRPTSPPAPPPTSSSTSTTTTAGSTSSTTTSTTVVPVGDWDGASYDAGTIAGVTDIGHGARTISFDRYSYTAPGIGTVDAGGLRAEPIAAWWRASPFSNVRVQLRTFVLADDVEVLELDEAGRAVACAEPPPASSPTPSWDVVDSSVLDDPSRSGLIATLTYAPTGEVTRIRFTAGC